MPAGVINRKEFMQTHRTCLAPHLTKYHLIAIARSENGNGQAVAEVAVALFSPRGKLMSWVAYWGSAEPELSTKEVAQAVAKHGFERSQRDGEHFFPRLDGTYYR